MLFSGKTYVSGMALPLRRFSHTPQHLKTKEAHHFLLNADELETGQ